MGHISKESENKILKDVCTPLFIAALFTTAKVRKQPKCPSMVERIKKTRYMYIYSGILSSNEKGGICNTMDGGS